MTLRSAEPNSPQVGVGGPGQQHEHGAGLIGGQAGDVGAEAGQRGDAAVRASHGVPRTLRPPTAPPTSRMIVRTDTSSSPASSLAGSGSTAISPTMGTTLADLSRTSEPGPAGRFISRDGKLVVCEIKQFRRM